MDRKTAKELNDALEAALQSFAAQHNLSIRSSGGSYDSSSFTPKIKFTELAADGGIKVGNVLGAHINHELFFAMGVTSLKAEDVLNKRFLTGAGEVTVIDFQARGKYHWIVRKANGKVVRCTNETMLSFKHPIAA